MAYYGNSQVNALFSAVEFAPPSEKNTAFFYGSPERSAALRAYLTQTLGQTIVAQVKVQDKDVFITHGSNTQTELMQALASQSALLAHEKPKKQFQPWKWRGGFNFAGQGLQLVSGYFKQGGLDAPKLVFAFTNILASCINVIFGAQKSDDSNHLRFIKKQFHQSLKPYLSKEAQQASEQAALQDAPPEKGFKNFIAHHSVRFGELGLRYFASLALTFPIQSWGKAVATLVSKGPAAALRVARNPDKTSFYAGLVYLLGKSIGLLSEVPDPYSAKPHTMIDTVREKVFFRLSSAIETGAASTLAYGSFKSGRITVAGKPYRDIPGGVGGALLASGLVTRYFAPFGVREVNMQALQNYLVATLAQIPSEKLSPILAQTAAEVKEHFNENAAPYGQIYTELARGVHEYQRVHGERQQPIKTDILRADMRHARTAKALPITHVGRLREESVARARNY